MSAAISPAETEISTSTALAAPPPANSSAAPTAAKPSPLDRFELAVTFTAAYANQASGISNFWLNGGSAEVAGNLYRHLSIAGNFTGLHSGSAGQAGASGANNNLPLSLLTYTVGPRLTYVVPQTDSSHTVTIFTEFLAGEAHGFNSLFPALPTVTTSANSLALQLNVAGQVTLTPHLTFRVIQAGWLRTQLPNTLNNAQNNLQISSGVVLHF
jgi:peptidoglycan-associated lipoprotein